MVTDKAPRAPTRRRSKARRNLLRTLVLAPLLVLGLKWGAPARGERALWLGTLVLNLTLLAATWQARGLIGLWLAD